MQHHHQDGSSGGGGGGAPPPLCGYPNPQGEAAPEVAVMSSEEHQKLGDLGIAEAASPISSRPPAAAAIGSTNFEELMRASAAEGGSTSGNRWPRQETLALLQIRSEMDAAFRDATVKGPLWEQVSRKLAELGYKRSAKKCKEKFENVHKYYKRTKEGRAGRQDGKSYKFFTQLEALHHSTSTSQVAPRIPTSSAAAAAVSLPPPLTPTSQPEALLPQAYGGIGISFSSNSSSSSSSEEDDDEEQDQEMETESADHSRRGRKRKRSTHSGGDIDSDERMMEFFEGLMKQVMQKQEAMQQKFLEAIEKREQDRMIREEAWKRQDMARIAREHDLMAQERALSASRDAAIIAFLEKITGQKIHLPTTTTVPIEQQYQRQSESQNNQQQQQSLQQQQQQQSHSDQQRPQSMEIIEARQVSTTGNEIVPAAIPEQQMQIQDFTGGGNVEGMTSSRWPKAEVLALIQLRSGMESSYQEAGPKGPLWEEISAGMQRMGYNRSAKRCKEKWENINKYFKKVKESNKKRPEDAKTCPYFHELDALYRKKILGNTSGGINLGMSDQQRQQQDLGMPSSLQSLQVNINASEDKDGGKTDQMQTSGVGAYTSTLFGGQSQGDIGEPKQPEDMLKKQFHIQHQQSSMMINDYCTNNVDDCYNNSDDLDDEEEEEVDENEEYDDHHKSEEEMKMAYKIQCQRQNGTNAAGATPSTTSSFMAMHGSVISPT
ncbi:Transcription factor GT-2 [Handroanthus impetiginosus]|uniref:Transcription factor GT-2 n=1 Tax=Handroanthus impetiginosus TaxID=429701 RepID=A0A2G9H855_9LAMI|nr:Transcription factor GT-2 [Handroanthus impetiginosus]